MDCIGSMDIKRYSAILALLVMAWNILSMMDI
jgi:hypothetical protein